MKASLLQTWPLTFFAVTSIMCGVSISLGQSPELDWVDPAGGQRGSTIHVTLSGDRLERASGLLFYRRGIRLASLAAEDEETVVAELKIEPDCPLGEHPFRVVGPRGVSEVRTLHIGPFPVIEEVEPNTCYDEAQLIEGDLAKEGVTIRGVIESADLDCFRVHLTEGQRLSAEVEAIRLGAALVDAHLQVLDSTGRIIAASDDTPLLQQDPLLSIAAAETGDYVVRVREAAFGGDEESRYRLHLGGFARPLVAYPAGGPTEDQFDVRLIGDPRGDIAVTAHAPSRAGSFQIRPELPGEPPTPAAIKARSSEFANVMESEPNDEIKSAAPSGIPPFALNGILETAGDEDCFRFTAQEGDQFDVELFGARVGSPIDSVITIYGPDGDIVVQNDDGVVHDSALRFVAAATGDHVLRVQDHLQRGGPTYVYRVEFQPVRPRLHMTVPSASRINPQQRQAAVVPRGGRFVMLVAVRRESFQGQVETGVSRLPVGVSLEAGAIQPGRHLGLLLFEAAADAPLGARLISVNGQGLSENGSVFGAVRQHIGLVLGEPRQTIYHGVSVDRIPLVVTEATPFAIEVAAPRAPLAQDGRLELRVIARRAPGFDGPIQLDAPLLPPWIERSEDRVEIAAGESEALFPLIAQDRAEPNTWPVVLVGQARVDGGIVEVASQLFDVAIAPPRAVVAIDRVATAQGSEAEVVCHVDWRTTPSSGAVARLAGLPKHASAPEVTIVPGQTTLKFPVSVGEETPASIHNTLFVELVEMHADEAFSQYLGRGGVLEVFPSGGSARETASRLQVLRRRHRGDSALVETRAEK